MAKGYINRTKEYERYLICTICNFHYKHAIPDDPYAKLKDDECPNCGHVSRALLDENGKQIEINGRPQFSIIECDGYKAVAEWKRQYVIQEKQLPFKYSPNQHLRFSHKFGVETLPKLSHVEFYILFILFMHQGPSGWAKMSNSTIAAYAKGGQRETPLHHQTVRNAIKVLSSTYVETWLESEGRYQEYPLVQVERSDSTHKYRVTMPWGRQA